jgi:hypothetical protein
MLNPKIMAFPEWTATIITDICCRVISGIVDMTRAEHLKVAQFHDVPSTMFLKVSIPILLALLSRVDSISYLFGIEAETLSLKCCADTGIHYSESCFIYSHLELQTPLILHGLGTAARGLHPALMDGVPHRF